MVIKLSIRTDLITEQAQLYPQGLSGVTSYDEKVGSATLSTVKISSSQAANSLGKPQGIYCTVEFERLDRVCDTTDIIDAITKALEKLMPKTRDSVLVVGLGNTDITPDALGPFTADGVIATRHITDKLRKDLGLENLKTVSCLIPGVLGKTGIEAYDVIAAAAERTDPTAIIAVDALAARSPERLCRTVQLSSSGICPGSGVNNSRKELNEKSFGIPVIGIGIPTVIDAGEFGGVGDNFGNMMVTPKEIDLLIEKSASLLSKALNIFLQPDLDEQIIDSLA